MATIYGTGNAEILGGTQGDDTIWAFGGNDTVLALSGKDFVWGGGGADIMSGGSGDDELRGEANNDELEGGAGADKVYGSDGADTLWSWYQHDSAVDYSGPAYADLLDGGTGEDKLFAEVGTTAYGGANDDELLGFGFTHLNGGDGADLFGLYSTDTSSGGKIYGGPGDDHAGIGISAADDPGDLTIDLGADDDSIDLQLGPGNGTPYAIKINLGSGEDYFEAIEWLAQGSVTLGTGADLFEFDVNPQSASEEAAGFDVRCTVTDFKRGQDLLDLNIWPVDDADMFSTLDTNGSGLITGSDAYTDVVFQVTGPREVTASLRFDLKAAVEALGDFDYYPDSSYLTLTSVTALSAQDLYV